MPVKRQISEPDGIFFITFTCHQWRPLIDIVNGYDVICKWFDYLKKQGHFIVGYVIMPNHVHALIAFRNTGQKINTVVGNGKRFMAYEIISRLKNQKQTKLIEVLHESVSIKDLGRNKKHEVWESSFDWKECRTNEYMKQKLDYMHANPCTGKWSLSDEPVNYPHSSASFYLTGKHSEYPVLNYCELADIDLTKPLPKDAEPASFLGETSAEKL